MAKKTWVEKRNVKKKAEVKVLDKKFADILEGEKMLIATPQIINEYVNQIPMGISTSPLTLRNDLAIEYQADKTCPVTTGIFLRIVSEAAYEEYQKGKDIKEIAPFWRLVEPNSKLAAKLECGVAFIQQQRKSEGIE